MIVVKCEAPPQCKLTVNVPVWRGMKLTETIACWYEGGGGGGCGCVTKCTGDLHSARLRYINLCPWVCTLDHSATLTTDLTTVLPTATMRQVSQVLIVRTRKCYNHCVCGNAFDRYTPCYLTPRCLSTWRRAICSPHQACAISKLDRGSWRGSHWPFVWRSASMHG